MQDNHVGIKNEIIISDALSAIKQSFLYEKEYSFSVLYLSVLS